MDAWRGVGRWMALFAAAGVAVAGLTAGASSRSGAAALRAWAGPGPVVAPAPPSALAAQEPAPEKHRFEIVARRYTFTPARIEVRENDLVTIVFSTDDIPHSFTIDEYRIAKRAAPGRPATFQFRAEKAGTFVFYCNLTTEDGCKKMRGELVVKPK